MFNKSNRQMIVDEYLNITGKNMFVPEEFVHWLSTQPDHEVYNMFFGASVEEEAHQNRIQKARRFVSGLRVTVKVQVQDSTVVKLRVEEKSSREYPSMISRRSRRSQGGGYEPYDPSDGELRVELKNQAGISLNAWLNRYRGIAEEFGQDLSRIEELIKFLRDEDDDISKLLC